MKGFTIIEVLIVLCVGMVLIIIGVATTHSNRLQKVCGPVVSKYEGTFEDHKSYKISINNQEFTVDEPLWSSINIGDIYCKGEVHRKVAK
jgi:competence protein ComGC